MALSPMSLQPYHHCPSTKNPFTGLHKRHNFNGARITPLTVRRGMITGTSVQEVEYELDENEKLAWTGDTFTSRIVAALISFPPLYSLLKFGARQVLIRTAKKYGIAWEDMANEILTSKEIYLEKEALEDTSLVYPDYYLKPFHAYDKGNLCWEAAAEVEAATMSLARRVLPSASSLEEATQKIRGSWLQTIEDHHMKYSNVDSIKDILDIGCSVGISTGYLATKFPNANVTGLDLSPYFLAVAQFKQKKKPGNHKPIKWVHAKAEETSMPSASFDLVSLASVLHELPQYATKNMLKEAFRILRPGGTIALTDNSPKSKILQKLPPAIFTLMKSTEPYLDEYHTLDLEKAMEDAGFINVTSLFTDPRHITVTGTVPNK